MRIQTIFDMLKSLIEAFRYRFVSERPAYHSGKSKKNETLRKTSQKRIGSIRRCHEACERFVMLDAIIREIQERYGSKKEAFQKAA